MGLYARHIGPRFVSCLCSMQDITAERLKVVPYASGTVLEIGIGPRSQLAALRSGPRGARDWR